MSVAEAPMRMSQNVYHHYQVPAFSGEEQEGLTKVSGSLEDSLKVLPWILLLLNRSIAGLTTTSLWGKFLQIFPSV